MDLREHAAQWMLKETWGFDNTSAPDEMQTYAKALLPRANGDGRLKRTERHSVVGLGAVLDFTESALDDLRNYTAQEDPAAVSKASSVSSSRAVGL